MKERDAARTGGGPVLYVWHTALMPERLSARIQVRAKTFGPDWRLAWKVARGGYRLWLYSELPVFRIRGQTPLRLWVRPEGEGCRVTGAFLPPLWSLIFDVLAPLVLAELLAQRGHAVSWRLPAAMIVFMLFAPRLFTAWGRDRRLLRWVGEDLLGSGEERGLR